MKKYLLLILSFIAIVQSSSAQSLWTAADLSYEFNKKLTGFIEAEYRTSDKFKSTDRWSAAVGLNYKPIKYLRLGAEYKFIYKHVDERVTSKGNVVEDFWQPRQRLAISAAGVFKLARFTFSLRERYQFTHHKGMTVGKTDMAGNPKKDEVIASKNRQVLRSRLKVEYSIKKSGFSPYISAELYNDLRQFSYDKTRYTIGTEYKFNRHNSVEAFYRYIDRADIDEAGGHIIGLGYQFKF